jgi:hypothetical protein
VERLQVQTGTAGPPVFDVKAAKLQGAAIKPLEAGGKDAVRPGRIGRKLLEMDYDAFGPLRDAGPHAASPTISASPA